MNQLNKWIIIALLICFGCTPKRIILNPVEDESLKNISDKFIYERIDETYRDNVIRNGAYEGIQCLPEVEDLDSLISGGNFDNYKSFNCICFNYKVKTAQGVDLYVGIKTGYYLNTRVCYDSSNSTVERPNMENLILTSTKSKNKHLDLAHVKSITESIINRKSKFGKFPSLVYQINQDRIIWKVRRHFGKLNVTVHEFDIDAGTGELLRHRQLPYKRTFLQWIGGTGI